ncbi:hypothetical protein FKM82_006054 [Ascaphus truei]
MTVGVSCFELYIPHVSDIYLNSKCCLAFLFSANMDAQAVNVKPFIQQDVHKEVVPCSLIMSLFMEQNDILKITGTSCSITPLTPSFSFNTQCNICAHNHVNESLALVQKQHAVLV